MEVVRLCDEAFRRSGFRPSAVKIRNELRDAGESGTVAGGGAPAGRSAGRRSVFTDSA